VTTNTVTAYLLQQIQLFRCSPTGIAWAFRPGARRAIGLPSRRSSSVTNSAVPPDYPDYVLTLCKALEQDVVPGAADGPGVILA
jgi:hypothetical protein